MSKHRFVVEQKIGNKIVTYSVKAENAKKAKAFVLGYIENYKYTPETQSYELHVKQSDDRVDKALTIEDIRNSVA